MGGSGTGKGWGMCKLSDSMIFIIPQTCSTFLIESYLNISGDTKEMSLLEYFLNIFRLVVFAIEFDQDTSHQAQCVSI